jgi:hypothetical protein
VKIIGDLKNTCNQGLQRLVFCDSITHQSQEPIMKSIESTAKRRQYIQLAIGLFWVIVLSLLLLLTGCATTTDTESKAQNAAMGDVASSVVGIAAGAAEANPLGLFLIPVKFATLEYTKTLPDGEREYAQSQMSAIWGGATASNLCTIGVLLSGGATAIPCLVAGLGYGLYDWQAAQPEREFWAICADQKTKNPALVCTFVKPTS